MQEAERRAARAGGDVIRLPVSIVPPSIEDVFKRLQTRYRYLGLSTLPGDAEVQVAIRGGRLQEASRKMEKAINDNSPPAGYQCLESDPNVWCKVEGGKVVSYWCYGKEYTPAEYAATFNGGFDPDATIATSSRADVSKSDLRHPTYDSGFHDGQRLHENHDLSLSLFDLFSVNGGGFDI